jgi:hypothetical protein
MKRLILGEGRTYYCNGEKRLLILVTLHWLNQLHMGGFAYWPIGRMEGHREPIHLISHVLLYKKLFYERRQAVRINLGLCPLRPDKYLYIAHYIQSQ